MHIMQFFAYRHVPPHLQTVSKQFADLAAGLDINVPNNEERTIALRKLLEAKDDAVRAVIAKAEEIRPGRRQVEEIRTTWTTEGIVPNPTHFCPGWSVCEHNNGACTEG